VDSGRPSSSHRGTTAGNQSGEAISPKRRRPLAFADGATTSGKTDGISENTMRTFFPIRMALFLTSPIHRGPVCSRGKTMVNSLLRAGRRDRDPKPFQQPSRRRISPGTASARSSSTERLPGTENRRGFSAGTGFQTVRLQTRSCRPCCCHGGGGTRVAKWVNIGPKRGYAALAIDTCASSRETSRGIAMRRASTGLGWFRSGG